MTAPPKQGNGQHVERPGRVKKRQRVTATHRDEYRRPVDVLACGHSVRGRWRDDPGTSRRFRFCGKCAGEECVTLMEAVEMARQEQPPHEGWTRMLEAQLLDNWNHGLRFDYYGYRERFVNFTIQETR